ncbi:hypothetical protein M758_1G209500 [Ceratodon purpureus]|nr:hypothetical protein M758_1G209500 [Ceratodon purpureus]
MIHVRCVVLMTWCVRIASDCLLQYYIANEHVLIKDNSSFEQRRQIISSQTPHA